MRDEHRHVLAVGGFEEELFGSVLRRIVGHLRRMVAGSAARGDVVAVDGRRRGEGVEREENLLLPVLAAETRHRADGRQRHVGLPVALVIVFVDLVLRVPEVFHPQVSPARSDRFEQIVGVLRDDGLQPPGFEQIDARQPIVGRTVVGHDIEFVVAALDGRIVVGEAGQQRTERLLLVRRPEENFTARRTFRREDEKPAAVVALPAAEIAQRMLRIAVYENVVGLRRTQTVVIDLLAFVLRRIDVRLRRVVGAVIEPFGVGGPCRAGELHPFDHILRQLTRRGIHDMYPHPIRTGFGGGIRAPTAVVGERDVDERRSTVGRKGIRIEEQFALSRERALAPQRRLVLKAVVEEIVVIVAVPLGRALLRIVVERRQPVVNGLTGREPVEVVARDGVFGFDPCGRLGRIVVFQPAVGIGDARTVVVVDDGRVAPRVGIG